MDKIVIPSKKDLEIERLKNELVETKDEMIKRTELHETAIIELTMQIAMKG